MDQATAKMLARVDRTEAALRYALGWLEQARDLAEVDAGSFECTMEQAIIHIKKAARFARRA